MIRCSQARRWVLSSREAGLGLDRRLALDQHLAGCAACSALDAQDRALEEALMALQEPPIEQLDVQALVGAVRAGIEARERVARERRRRLETVARRLGLAAAAAVVLLASWQAFQVLRSPAAEPSASSQPNMASAAEVAQPDDALAPSPDPDLSRLESARATTRAAFLPALERLPDGGDPLLWIGPVDQALAPLREQGWPVVRLIERLVSDSDPRLAGLALRWLGLRGDRLSIGIVAGILRRSGVGEELRRQSLLALCDAGEPAREALAPALDDPVLRPIALRALLASGTDGAVAIVAQAQAKSGADVGRDDELASALAQMGPKGLDALLHAATRTGGESRVALAHLRRTRGAREHAASALASPDSGRDVAGLLGVAARLGLPDALGPLAARCLQREQRADALEALAAFEGPGALAVLLDLWRGGRIPGHEVLPSARAVLERDPLEAPVLVEALEGSNDFARLRDLLDLLLHLESHTAAPGLARLAASPSLERDEREWAALAAGALGGDGEAHALAELLGSLEPVDSRLAAACLVSIHQLGGPPAARAALYGGTIQQADRLLELLARRPEGRNQAVTLSRAARLLEPWLDPRNPQRPRTAP